MSARGKATVYEVVRSAIERGEDPWASLRRATDREQSTAYQVGVRIRTERRRRGMTALGLAARARVAPWRLTGQPRRLTFSDVERIAAVLDADTGTLLGVTPE